MAPITTSAGRQRVDFGNYLTLDTSSWAWVRRWRPFPPVLVGELGTGIEQAVTHPWQRAALCQRQSDLSAASLRQLHHLAPIAGQPFLLDIPSAPISVVARRITSVHGERETTDFIVLDEIFLI